MATTTKLKTCSVCGQTRGKYQYDPAFDRKVRECEFKNMADLNAHMQYAHPTEWQARQNKALQTRKDNQQRKAQEAADAKARMVSASQRVVRKWTSGYDMALDYEFAYIYERELARVPTPAALQVIEALEYAIKAAQERLEAAKADAWETGSPVTEAQVQVARSAGMPVEGQ
jgi:hypothetical protein